MRSDEQFYGSYCGLYCGACEIMRAYEAAAERGEEAQWDDLPEPIRSVIPRAHIHCQGCRSDDVFAGCAKCPIRKCAKRREGIETCLDCRRYPCIWHRLMGLVRFLLRFEKKLPHLVTARRNLADIKARGIGAWLAEQRERWACPDCGERFGWYRAACAKCGRELDDVRPFERPPTRG